ncbi:MAG: DUF2029 domain-containing protein [Chlorobium sp.]|nr:DUF2029 domain-containing protein [Chlorobium sp.]
MINETEGVANAAFKDRARLLEFFFYVFCLSATALFVYWRGQDRNWDLLNYHFYQGYSLLNGRFMVDLAAANLQSFFNPIVNVFAYLSLAHLPFPFSAWSILAIQLTSIPVIVLVAKEIGGGLGYTKSFRPAIPAIALSLLSPLWGSELGTTFFSSWTAPLILWGVYFLLQCLQGQGFSKSRIVIAGVLFGLAAGLKLTNAPFAISGLLMITVLLYRSDWRGVVSGSAYFLTACGVGFAFTAWWNWLLWSIWGSPFFPLYNAIFKSEYYDFVNFRDMRWHFSSFQDFLLFIVQSCFGTGKTSEIPFADIRYLFVALLVPAAILCKPAIRLNSQLMAFIAFMTSGYLLWAFMLAYQRYLIPFELFLGLLIWILVDRIVEREWLRKGIMIGVTLCAALMLKVPDWGHAPMALGGKNPFSIEMDTKLSSTPARYVVVGVPISYVLPSFHPDSLFYGVGFTRQVDDLVFRKLAEHSKLPLRILAKDSDAPSLPDRLKRAGYDLSEHSLDCNYFRTGLGRYIVCEVQFPKRQSVGTQVVVDADFSVNGYLKTKGILWERGLSHVEPWGRWSDGDQVELGLTGCLPQGRLKLMIVGHAFGPNVGLPVKVVLGSKEIVTTFADSDTEQSAYITNEAKCVDKVVIKIPKPTSPQELGQSTDSRKLGIGWLSLNIIKE